MTDRITSCGLTANQQFICAYDDGDDGPFGPHYTITHGWWVYGEVSATEVQSALDTLSRRHEVLNTVIQRAGGSTVNEAHQEIHPARPVPLRVVEEVDDVDRDRSTAEHLAHARNTPLPATELPLMRATLVVFTPETLLLILTFHHLAVDGVAVRVLARELAELLAREQGHVCESLPEPAPYREYAAWEEKFLCSDDAERHRQHWRRVLDGARIQTWPTDVARGSGRVKTTGTCRFTIDVDTTARLHATARAHNATLFMVCFAAYALLCAREGEPEVTVPTFSPGRPPDFAETVGPFFNFTPLRIDLRAGRTLTEAIERVRGAALAASEHDIPAIPALVPETMMPAMQSDRATAVFQVFPFPHLLDHTRVGGLEFTEVRRWSAESANGSGSSDDEGAQIPDGCLWTVSLDPNTPDIVGTLDYRRDLFDPATARGLARRYVDLLEQTTAAPDVAVEQLALEDA
ncbi:condensation domain-containing protein [Nocardia sp. CNY236]|uniref:condensation domain-containing protein n=1 Tax=Nocardia sp. CNY236 TaxID=1169152 RepID=UPI00041FF2F8|nr:condensation domain-containing protein [Nocardia sp. CNY236]